MNQICIYYISYIDSMFFQQVSDTVLEINGGNRSNGNNENNNACDVAPDLRGPVQILFRLIHSLLKLADSFTAIDHITDFHTDTANHCDHDITFHDL